MINYNAFVLAIGYIHFCLFSLAVIDIGGVLTVLSAGTALVGYYPSKVLDWVLIKFAKGV